MTKELNEFRKDLVSGEWVLFVTGRRHSLRKKEGPEFYQPKESCPFEDFTEQEVLWSYPNEKDAFATVIKNKYPAVKQNLCTTEQPYGPFKTFDAIGDHEIIVYRDHDHGIYDFSQDDFVNMVRVFKKRYSEIIGKQECTKYILIFHNNGHEAGASIFHPHSQVITTPILPPDVAHSINGSLQYYKEHKKRVYAELLEWEQKERKRVIYENKDFIVFCPFVSKYPYEIRIFSKEGHAHFDQMPDKLDEVFADALHTSIKKLGMTLDKPPFNLFIHTAPLIEESGVAMHEFYHWHVEIIPHLKIDAGFELGTGIEVNPVNPDESAELLRNANIKP